MNIYDLFNVGGVGSRPEPEPDNWDDVIIIHRKWDPRGTATSPLVRHGDEEAPPDSMRAVWQAAHEGRLLIVDHIPQVRAVGADGQLLSLARRTWRERHGIKTNVRLNNGRIVLQD